jgi:hypothetical protein
MQGLREGLFDARERAAALEVERVELMVKLSALTQKETT